MKVIYGIGNLSKASRRPKVATIGVFDGVHRGHQRILRQVVAQARRRGWASAVVTFDDHPTVFLAPFQKTPCLTSLPEKLILLRRAGIQWCYVLRFDREISRMPARKFLDEILLDGVRAASLYVGEDFVFGRGGRGDAAFLRRLSRERAFQLRVVRPFTRRGRVVSSTLVRSLLRRGDLAQASFFLGRRAGFSGKVVRGDGRGKGLGFPTANIRPAHDVLVPDGVYAARAACAPCARAPRAFNGLAYIGRKPTFSNGRRRRVFEVHLLGFRGSLAGKSLEVSLVKKIRSDRRFSGPQPLIAQMRKDAIAAQKILSSAS